MMETLLCVNCHEARGVHSQPGGYCPDPEGSGYGQSTWRAPRSAAELRDASLKAPAVTATGPGALTGASYHQDQRRKVIDDTLAFLADVCHPEQYGHAVPRDARQRARTLASRLEDLV